MLGWLVSYPPGISAVLARSFRARPHAVDNMEQEPSEGQVKELQAFMETENQKAVIQAAISKLTDICFEKCITKPGTPSPSRQP